MPGVVVLLLFAAWVASLISLSGAPRSPAQSELLAQLEGRNAPSAADVDPLSGPAPTGSPFLEGQTVTVAGAALLQRVATAVTQFGGNVLSSQVELEGAKPRTATSA